MGIQSIGSWNGGNIAVALAVNGTSPAVVSSSPTPRTGKSYCLRIDDDGDYVRVRPSHSAASITPGGSDSNVVNTSHAFGIWVYLPDAESFLSERRLLSFICDDETTPHYEIWLSGGSANFSLRNSAGSAVGNWAHGMSNNTWHWLQVGCYLSNSDVFSEMSFRVDGNTVVLDSGVGDTLGGANQNTNVRQIRLYGGGINAGSWAAFGDWMNCDGSVAGVGGEYTLANGTSTSQFLNVVSLRPTIASATPTVGTNLSSGQWADAGETPWNTTNNAQYTGSNQNGRVVLSTVSEDPEIAVYGWYLQRGNGSGTVFTGYSGNDTDTIQTNTIFNVETTPQYMTTKENAGFSAPTTTKDAMIGFGKDNGGRDIIVHEMQVEVPEFTAFPAAAGGVPRTYMQRQNIRHLLNR